MQRSSCLLLVKPRFSQLISFIVQAHSFSWDKGSDLSINALSKLALCATIKSEVSNHKPTLCQSMFFPATISLVMPFTSDASSEIGIPGSLNDS